MADLDSTARLHLRFCEKEIPEFIRKYRLAKGPHQAELRRAYGQILRAMFALATDVVCPVPGNRLQGESTGAGVKGGA